MLKLILAGLIYFQMDGYTEGTILNLEVFGTYERTKVQK